MSRALAGKEPLVILGMLAAAACHTASDPVSPDASMSTPPARVGIHVTERSSLCHVTDSGQFMHITVADPALPDHWAHGDRAVGDLVPGQPGFVFDAGCAPVRDTQLLFDNGQYSGGQWNTRNMAGSQELFEDFTLAQPTIITSIVWQQHDQRTLEYLNTEVLVFAGLPYSGAPVYSASLVATRTPNATGTLYGEWEGYDYQLTGLALSLPPGAYWIGLNSRVGDPNLTSSWDNTTGTSSTLAGFRVINFRNPAPGLLYSSLNLAYQLHGYVE
jgi:hypothetical protein